MLKGPLIALAAIALLPSQALAANKISIPSGSTIVTDGDSLTVGVDHYEATGPVIVAPYPAQLQSLLGHGVKVRNVAVEGYRTTDILNRGTPARGAAVVLMVGSNDSENYGQLQGGYVFDGEYRDYLTKIVGRYQALGAKVIVVTPPPVRSADEQDRIQVYRDIALSVAADTGSVGIDLAPVLADLGDPTQDGVHLKPAAYAAIARAVADHIEVAP